MRGRWLMPVMLVMSLCGIAQQPLFFEQSKDQALPPSSVFAVAVDQQGFTWIGTAEGLFRFDGHRYVAHLHRSDDPGSISENSIRSLLPNEDGSIWIGTYGEGISLYDPSVKSFRNYSLNNEKSTSTLSGRVWSLARVGDQVLAGTEGGLFKYNPDKDAFEALWPLPGEPLQEGQFRWTRILAAESDAAWLSIDRSYYRYNAASSSLEKFNSTAEHPIMKVEDVKGLTIDPDGVFWFCRQGSTTLNRWDPVSNELDSRDLGDLIKGKPESWTNSRILSISPGKVWFVNRGKSQFLFDWNSGKVDSLFFLNGQPSQRLDDPIFDIAKTPDDRMILATSSGLLIEKRLTHPISYLPLGGKELKDQMMSVAISGDDLYTCSRTHIYHIHNNSSVTELLSIEDKPHEDAYEHFYRRLQILKDGDLGIISMKGIQRLNTTTGELKWVLNFSEIDEFVRHPQVLLEDSRGRTWLGTWSTGILMIDEHGAKRQFRPYQSKIPGDCVLSISEDPRDSCILIGLNAGGGIWKYNEEIGDFTAYLGEAEVDNRPALPCGVINDILFKDDLVYIATHGCGLLVYDESRNELRQFELSSGIPGNYLYRLIWDPNQDCLLVRSNHGAFKWNPATGESEVLCSVFIQHEPLLSTGFAFGYDEKVWFVTNEELIGVATGRADQLAALRPLTITSISAEGEELLNEGNEEFHLNHSQNTLQIKFSAMHITAGKTDIQYAYRLNEGSWLSLGNDPELVLAGLASGSHALELQYKDESGKLSPISLLQFYIAPPFYQTWWFILAIVSGVLAGIYFATRIRYERRLREINLRNRIAGDLHDDLGSTLSSIRIFSNAAISRIDHPEQAREILEKISSSAGNTMEKMGDIVWSIHPGANDLQDLGNKVRNFGSEILGSAGILGQFELPDKTVKLNIEARKNILLISKEAINNAAKYSSAKNFRFRLDLIGDRLSVLMEDDGEGFDPEAGKRGHGLRSMHDRCHSLGGKFEMNSSPGQGTRLKFSFPIANIRDAI